MNEPDTFYECASMSIRGIGIRTDLVRYKQVLVDENKQTDRV